MNLFVIACVLGQVCKFEAGFMLLPMVCALCYSEYSIALIFFFLCALLCLTVGFFLTLKSRNTCAYGRRKPWRQPPFPGS